MGMLEKLTERKFALSVIKIIFDLKTPRFNDIKKESFRREGAQHVDRVLKWLLDKGFVEKFEDKYMLSEGTEEFCADIFGKKE